MSKLKMRSLDLTEKNIKKIGELFPNVITEVQAKDGSITHAIDFDRLRQELSTTIVEGPVERYQLDWPGKRESLLAANAPIAKTLRPVPEESVDFDTTENLFIEGDNLEALKLLQESYLGKVKMIYIDPPYNTGNDFVYNDDFAENSDEYLERSLQKDEEGNRLVANSESNGRFHSDWLSMMHSRLRLARNLLTDDGVIFISIDENEQANLKKLCDEIFGEENFIEIFSWVKTSTPPSLSLKTRKTNEYVLCYEKLRNKKAYNGELLEGGDQPLLNTGNKARDLIIPKEKIFFSYLDNGVIEQNSGDKTKLLKEIKVIDGYPLQDVYIRGPFKWTQDFLDKEVEAGTKFIVKSDKLSIRFLRNEIGYKRPNNYIREDIITPLINKADSSVDTNENASAFLRKLLGGDYFSYPKPVSLIKYLMKFISDVNEEDIILDFFAGSSTTAHAVMQLNAEDGGNRKFIMVQLPEATDEKSEAYKAGYQTIAEISKERIRRAGKQILESENIHEDWNRDIGFRVLKVDSSNMKEVYYQPQELTQADLLDQVDNVKEDRTPEDLLFQVMLDWGLELSLPITTEEIEGKKVFFVADDALIACFDAGITESLVKTLAEREPLRLLFRDNHYLNNDTKINAEQLVKQIAPNTELKSI